MFYRFQSFIRLPAHIKCPVESHGHIPRRNHQFLHFLHIHLTVGSQTSHYNSIDPYFAGHLYIPKHDFTFFLAIQEISAPGTNNDMHPGRYQFAHQGYFTVRRSCPPLRHSGTKFNTVGTCRYGRPHAFRRIGTYFYLKIFTLHHKNRVIIPHLYRITFVKRGKELIGKNYNKTYPSPNSLLF